MQHPVGIGRQGDLRILIFGDIGNVFLGNIAVTQIVLKSALVISGCVGSLIMLPGATFNAVTLPPTGAVTASSRDAGLASADAPSVFKCA